MSGSLVGDVVRRGVVALWLALAAIGVGTGAGMVGLQVRALDQALLAAVYERAHPDVEGWDAHSGSGIEAWVATADDPRIPPEAFERAMRTERPVLVSHAGHRIALIVGEREQAGGEEHLLAAARATSVSWVGALWWYALSYTVAAALLGGLAALGLARTTRASLAPLERARDDATAALGLARGVRLDVDGPDEVQALLQAVNGLLERIDTAHAAQVRFTAEAAHELRTPVTVLLGELDVTLRKPRSTEAYRAALEVCREEVHRLHRLVDGLTLLARVDGGAAALGREPIRARELVDAALVAAGPGLTAAGCALTVHATDDPEVCVHRALVEAALGNLLRNVAAHAPGAAVTVTVESHGGGARFTVDDDGPGLAKAERAAVFDRFVRGEGARRHSPEGLGLGLPLVAEIARQHGGRCELQARPGGGLRAIVWLPGGAR
ncbi:MAG: signal transduction histidine kinase [Myxococcota bacterium]